MTGKVGRFWEASGYETIEEFRVKILADKKRIQEHSWKSCAMFFKLGNFKVCRCLTPRVPKPASVDFQNSPTSICDLQLPEFPS